MLHHVQKLYYDLECLSKEVGEIHDERRARRLRDSTAILESIAKWRADIESIEPPKSALAVACGSFARQSRK